jgi:hypothetical protein
MRPHFALMQSMVVINVACDRIDAIHGYLE